MAPTKELKQHRPCDRQRVEPTLRPPRTRCGDQRSVHQKPPAMFPQNRLSSHSSLSSPDYDPALLQVNPTPQIPPGPPDPEILQCPRTASSGRRLIVVTWVTHMASCCRIDLSLGSYGPQSLPPISDHHSLRRKPLHLHYSESERLAAALPNSLHQFLCSESGAPTPTALYIHCHRHRTHTLHGRELPLRSPLPAGARRCKETPPDSRDLRFPFRHSLDTFRKATECDTQYTL